MPLSRTVAPYSPPQTPQPSGRSGAQAASSPRFIRDTNPLERSLGEVRRRTKVMGRFPGETSCLTLVWAVLDLFFTHASNGATFTDLDRQHLYRINYQQADPDTLDEEVTAA